MASKTDFLKLTLPAFNEFFDSWGDINNQNFELTDDWMKALHDALVTTSVADDFAALGGNLPTLEQRLALAVDDDGNVIGVDDLNTLKESTLRGAFTSAQLRFEDSDEEMYDAGQPFTGTRYEEGVPSAGFPRYSVQDAGAFASRVLPVNSASHALSPGAPFASAHGLVVGGDTALISSGAENQFTLLVSGDPAIFNIDGYIFRLRESLKVDYSSLSAADNEYVWIYADRPEGSFVANAFQYSDPAGSPANKDLRKLRSGAGTGSSSGANLTATGETFTTGPFQPKQGDLLVVTSGTASGTYVILAITGATTLTVQGSFKADVGSFNWEIIDRAVPNIGAEIPSLNSTDPRSRPSYSDGRAYIGRIRHQSGGAGINAVTWRRGGVYDSGWITSVSAAAIVSTPLNRQHNLGAFPSRVELWGRAGLLDLVFPLQVRREYLMNTTPVSDFLWAPSMRYWMTETDIWVQPVNTSPDALSGATGPTLFTDESNADVNTGDIRIIAWR